MACYSPLKSFPTGKFNEKTGKPVLRILSAQTTAFKDVNGKFVEGQKIPCGQCIGCRLDYSREWAIRSYLEAKQYKFNYFITLTYNDDHLPRGKGWSVESGECFDSVTLEPKDLTKFIKDVRGHWKYHFDHIGIRFMAAGEYGDTSRRPHYHLIMYNLPIDDLKLWKTNYNKQKLYVSPTLSKIWGKGYVVIGEVTWESSAYVARYVMKKQTGKDNRIVYSALGQKKEFMRVSRNPGLARNYFEDNYKKIYETDQVFVNRGGKVIASKPVAYFDRLYEKINPVWLSLIKGMRQDAGENANDLVLQGTDLDEFDYLDVKKTIKESSIKALAKKL